jgi:hypothetical protein
MISVSGAVTRRPSTSERSLSPADPAVDWLRPRLAAASKEDLVGLRVLQANPPQ